MSASMNNGNVIEENSKQTDDFIKIPQLSNTFHTNKTKESQFLNNFEKFKKIAKENNPENKKSNGLSDIILPQLPKVDYKNNSNSTTLIKIDKKDKSNLLKSNNYQSNNLIPTFSNRNNKNSTAKENQITNLLPQVHNAENSTKIEGERSRQGKFQNIHNKNLDHLKKLNGMIEATKIRSSSTSVRKDCSLDRLNRIRKFFQSNQASKLLQESEELKENKDTNETNEVKRQIKETNTIQSRNIKEKYKSTPLYTYLIVPGNNSELIKKCMKLRENWKETTNPFEVPTFRWQQSSTGIDFSLYSQINNEKKIVNHFEYHKQISNKLNLFINMMRYCENKNLDVFDYLPLTVLIQYDSSSYLKQLQSFKDLYANISSFIVEDDEVKMTRASPKKSRVKKYTDYFTFNFQGDKLGGKTNLFLKKSHYEGKNMWLIKAVDLNRGRCIKMCDSIEKVEKTIKKFYKGMCLNIKDCVEEEKNENENEKDKESLTIKNKKEITSIDKFEKVNKLVSSSSSELAKNTQKVVYKFSPSSQSKYKTSTMILQKYIENPALYKGRKFDIRLWVLVTHKMSVFAFKEGHLKATSVEYGLDKTDTYVHLTNYSVQKYNESFSKYEVGNEISYKEYDEYLKSINSDKNVDLIMESILNIVKITMNCVKEKLNLFDRKHCFEIFGYDFILDNEMKPFLLEINTNPGLEESSPLIKTLVPRMIDDALRLTIDSLFITKYLENFNVSPYEVEGYSNDENLWKFVCDLKNENKKSSDT